MTQRKWGLWLWEVSVFFFSRPLIRFMAARRWARAAPVFRPMLGSDAIPGPCEWFVLLVLLAWSVASGQGQRLDSMSSCDSELFCFVDSNSLSEDCDNVPYIRLYNPRTNPLNPSKSHSIPSMKSPVNPHEITDLMLAETFHVVPIRGKAAGPAKTPRPTWRRSVHLPGPPGAAWNINGIFITYNG